MTGGDSIAGVLGIRMYADTGAVDSGLDRTAKAVQRARGIIDKEAQRIARSLQDGATKGVGAFTEQIKNASYQIADLATQIASGQSALVAFTQQGVQLVSAFGPAGAAIGAVGAVLGATAHALLENGSEADKAAKSTATFGAVLERLKAQAATAREEITKAAESYGDLSDAQKFFIEQQTKAKLAAAQATAEEPRKQVGQIVGGPAEFMRSRVDLARRESASFDEAQFKPQLEFLAAVEKFQQGGSIAQLEQALQGLQATAAGGSFAKVIEGINQKLTDLGLQSGEADKEVSALQATLDRFKDFKLPQLPYAAPERLNVEGSGLSYEGAGLEAIGKPSPVPVARDEAAADADYAQRAAKRQAEQARIAAQGKALTDSLRTAQETYNARVVEADQLLKRHAITTDTYGRAVAAAQAELDKANAQGERETASQRRIAEAQAEIEQLRQLQAAQGVSAAKYHEVTLEIAGERAARELGRDATQKERDASAALTIEQEKLKEAMARSQKLDDMSLQIDQQYRLQEAQDQSAKSYYETAKAIEVERAVRELGIGATDAEIQRVRALAAEKYDAENRKKYDATYDPAAGAKEALREMADQATEFGKLAGDALKGAADLGAEAFTEFAMTGKVNMQSLAQEIERSLIQGAIKQLVNSLIGVGGQAFASWLGSGAAPAGNGQSANPAVVTQHAHGGVRSGPSIQSFENTIVSRPTFFAFARGAGVMGEGRKPEGILPLARTSSGDLGVQVAGPMPMPSGGGMRVVVNNYGSPEQVQTSVRQAGGEDVLEVTIFEASRRQLNSGRMDGANKGSYGLRPRPLR